MANINEDNFDFLFKIVLIGDCGTGKTCVVQRFKNGTYVERHGNTIGVDFSMKTLTVDGKTVKVRETLVNLVIVITEIITVTDMGYSWSRTISYYNSELL